MLQEKIQADLKHAMLARDTVRTATIRFLISAMRYCQIEKSKDSMTNDEVVQVLRRQSKQRRDSIESYEKGNRPDLAERERQELTIIESYLPQQISSDELTTLIKSAITTTGATTKAQAGLVMKAVMPKLQGRADGKQVNLIVMQLLAG